VIWQKHTPDAWLAADASYERRGKEGVWKRSPKLPSEWQVRYAGSTFIVRPTSFKHTGIFPEQAVHWHYIKYKIENRKYKEPFRFLNLFGYTGGASLAAARAGAEVTHVDASKVANTWARENAAASGLADAKIRYITDDVVQFVKREIRRGNTYHGIVMDPPAFGRGTKGEVWKIEEHLAELITLTRELLAPDAAFLLMSGYAAGYSPMGFANLMQSVQGTRGGVVTCGEMGIHEQHSSRVLPTGMYAKWEQA
jgi:23S rRNA (cytosine1962-C5)-methyltransferase